MEQGMDNTQLILWIVGLVVFVCATVIVVGRIISEVYGTKM
jgi:hypothetical protein